MLAVPVFCANLHIFGPLAKACAIIIVKTPNPRALCDHVCMYELVRAACRAVDSSSSSSRRKDAPS